MAKSGKKAKSGKAKGFSTKKAGLKFSPGAIGGNLKRGRFAKRVSKAAAVYLASAIEYSVGSVPSTAHLRGRMHSRARFCTRAFFVSLTPTLYCTSELLELATKVAAKAKKTTLREVLCNRSVSGALSRRAFIWELFLCVGTEHLESKHSPKPRHIALAVRNDDELNKLLATVTIASGGVLGCHRHRPRAIDPYFQNQAATQRQAPVAPPLPNVHPAIAAKK